jgi:hypothetical protein
VSIPLLQASIESGDNPYVRIFQPDKPTDAQWGRQLPLIDTDLMLTKTPTYRTKIENSDKYFKSAIIISNEGFSQNQNAPSKYIFCYTTVGTEYISTEQNTFVAQCKRGVHYPSYLGNIMNVQFSLRCKLTTETGSGDEYISYVPPLGFHIKNKESTNEVIIVSGIGSTNTTVIGVDILIVAESNL